MSGNSKDSSLDLALRRRIRRLEAGGFARAKGRAMDAANGGKVLDLGKASHGR